MGRHNEYQRKRCTSPVFVVLQCKLVSARELTKHGSAPPYGPYSSGRTLCLCISLGRIASCSARDSTCCYTFLHSVVCRLSNSYTLLQLFDGFRCQHGQLLKRWRTFVALKDDLKSIRASWALMAPSLSTALARFRNVCPTPYQVQEQERQVLLAEWHLWSLLDWKTVDHCYYYKVYNCSYYHV